MRQSQTELPSIQHRESLVPYAKTAGIAVPSNLYDSDGYRHWDLYCNIQIERPIRSKDAPSYNAAIIAAIPLDRLESLKFEEISKQLK
jgi:hypothetical protein